MSNTILTSGQQLFVGMRYSKSSAMASHIALWRRLTKTPVTQYEILKVHTEFDGICEVLVFGKKAAYDEFGEWWNEYQKRFVGEEYLTGHIPSARDGVMITGYPLRHGAIQTKNKTPAMILNHFLQEWYWICEFTQDKVIWSNDFWLFESEADMVMFKLKGVVQTEDEDGDDMPF
jgi:hypothetical protein